MYIPRFDNYKSHNIRQGCSCFTFVCLSVCPRTLTVMLSTNFDESVGVGGLRVFPSPPSLSALSFPSFTRRYLLPSSYPSLIRFCISLIRSSLPFPPLPASPARA